MIKSTKRIILVLSMVMVLILNFTACAKSTSSNTGRSDKKTTKEITDMAGRKVTIPTDIKKVYTESPVALTFMYTLDSKKIAGLNYELTEGEKKYTDENYRNLPVLGGNYGQGKTINKEEVLKVNPDIILSMGDITSTTKSNADKLQKQMGIPVIVATGDLDKLDKAYEFVGDLLNESSRAKELGQYCKETYTEIKSTADKIPEDKRVKVYYAEGENGLQTDPKGSSHSQVLDIIGAINVADVKIQSGYGRGAVSMEQLLKWNPDAVIVCFDSGYSDPNAGPYKKITTDSNWSNLKAVKDKKIYQIPYLPFNWFDRPPSVNRIIGMKWLANLLYPDYFKMDIKTEVKNFYDKFYHKKLTDNELEEVMTNAK